MSVSNGVATTETADRAWLADLSDSQLREVIETRMAESEEAHGRPLGDLTDEELCEHEPLVRALTEGRSRPALYETDDEEGGES